MLSAMRSAAFRIALINTCHITSAYAGRNNIVAECSLGHPVHCLIRHVLMLRSLLLVCFLLSCSQNSHNVLSRVASLCQASEEPAAPILVGSSAPAGIDLAMRDRAKVDRRPHCWDLEFDDALGRTQPSSQGDRLMRLG